ncbi:hypothetical protein C1646_663370 [Rhizophagus diaphanus]|nr:hypothetical protein C1646_663370 [Rhizophagus diaphanus] [Rhizophagus sp. MUCL 43196]
MISVEKERLKKKVRQFNEDPTPVLEEYNADSEDDYANRPAQRAIDLLNCCDNLLYDMQNYIEERSGNNSLINIVPGIRCNFNDPNEPHPEDCICRYCQPPPACSPSLYSCCNEIICQCNGDNFTINSEEYYNSWIMKMHFLIIQKKIKLNIEEHIAWTMCSMDRQTLENMYHTIPKLNNPFLNLIPAKIVIILVKIAIMQARVAYFQGLFNFGMVWYVDNIKIKQVITSQPINYGGSRCTMECDTENHHMHIYCMMCKKNLFYGTTIYDGIIRTFCC